MPKILTFNELRDYGVHTCRRHLYRLEQRGKFPKRVQISEKRVGWLEAEIKAHVDARIKARR